MATFGHLAAGLALSGIATAAYPQRTTWREVAVIVVAAEAPDMDFVLPVRHRGMTHSAGFTAAVGIGVAAAYLPSGVRRGLLMGVVATTSTSTHALLDMLTGESGTAAAWPATDERVSLPEAPLPAMPIGAEIFSRDGMWKTVGEIAWALPLAVIGLWPWLARLLR